ncbi:activating transcription factor 7-interacting protein 1 isoform X3 [Frankliniella occidentalis]|uniref:Activating transcription factor 7-interacting protein 1 isoform X3 n=1 Tax=Frankliniella occidentalis TaxID=133901 RepID=A0A9C6U4P8_FRAOC|nr:activating transcription factor 7-interacting protein 1 isoform X3 [Frankliniella occidentalis]
MHRGSPPRRKPERAATLPSGASRKPHRRPPGSAGSAAGAAPAPSAARGRASGASSRRAPKPRRSRIKQSASALPRAPRPPRPQEPFTLADVLPTWRPTPKDTFPKDLRRADNVLLALGLKPANSRVAETFFRTAFAGRGRMHGIMEGPGEELTVAAIATEGLDDGHPHLNGVSTALLENGAPSPPAASKDTASVSPAAAGDATPGQPSPPVSPPAASPAASTSAPSSPVAPPPPASPPLDKKEASPPAVSSPPPAASPPAVASAPEEAFPLASAFPAEEASPAEASPPAAPATPSSDHGADDGDADASATKEEAPAETVVASPTVTDDASPEVETANTEAIDAVKDEEEKPEEQATLDEVSDNLTPIDDSNSAIDDVDEAEACGKPTDESKEKSDEEIRNEDEVLNEISKDCVEKPSESVLCKNIINGDVSVKVELESLGNSGEIPNLSDVQKEMGLENDAHQDEEACGSSESETSTRDNVSGGSEDFRMDVDLPSTDVKAEVIEDQEKSTDSGIVSEQQPSRKITQKRSSGEDLSENQAKKQCLPDIVCGDANALDLSGIKKKDIKEPKIALKPQSLLLSKLQGFTDLEKSKKEVYRSDDSALRLGESVPLKTSRRRSSREEKDSRPSNYQRRTGESNATRVLDRDQVLREMRTRVRSSYKERERAAKEENSLLRDLLEPERDTLMTDFVEAATQNGGITELDRVSSSLEAEIRQLTVEINAKEAEWNDLIRKKKMKEELALRVRRRKQVLTLTGDMEEDLVRRNSYEDESRAESKRDSHLDSRIERRQDSYREVTSKTGEELLAAALRLGSRNVEDYHHRNSSSSPLAVRIQARANELLTERKSSGPLPGLSHMQTPSLLQSQLTKPTEIPPSSSQSQFLLQHLQRQRVLMGAVSSTGSACRLSPSVSLSAISTPTSTSSALNASLPSAAVHKNLSRAEKQLNAATASRIQRPILPKPSTATSGGHVVSDSILAGARPGSSSGGGLLSMSLPALGSGAHVRTGSSGSLHGGAPVDLSELGFVLSSGAGSDGPSRPSSTESSLSGAPSQINPETGSGMSFKDVLVQFAKMTNANDHNSLSNQSALLARPPPPPYPEVTLHPVVATASVPSPVPATSTPTSSLLHGILTKPNTQSSGSGSQSHAKPATFSPTLARLLTAPERSSSSAHHNSSASVLPHYQTPTASSYGTAGPVLLSDLLSGGSSKKARSELTITPVSASAAASYALQNSSSNIRLKRNNVVVLDGEDGGDEGDVDTDSDERRLVIDEGDNMENGESPETDGRLDRSKNAVPHCQGCNERDAEFVCAGCQRQWYCSRECQIAAWDEHSEQCFPA